MADPVERTFTEKEAYALVADNVQRETAAAAATIETLNSEKAALQTQVDTLEAAKEAEKARADKAEADFAAYKDQLETEKAQAARKDERVAKIREVAKHLNDEFFTPERAERWSKLDDEQFAALVEDMTTPAGLVTEKANENQPPRETAMAGSSVQGTGKTPLLKQFLGGPAVVAQKTEV